MPGGSDDYDEDGGDNDANKVLKDEEADPDAYSDEEWALLISLICMMAGVIPAILMRFKLKKSKGPEWLIFLYACIAFVMSIVWISFTCDIIMDLLKLFGFITGLPMALFGLTVLAWGNCLGDMYANVAMTKRGFGEMAITGCLAGPIFNILVGIGGAFTKA